MTNFNPTVDPHRSVSKFDGCNACFNDVANSSWAMTMMTKAAVSPNQFSPLPLIGKPVWVTDRQWTDRVIASAIMNASSESAPNTRSKTRSAAADLHGIGHGASAARPPGHHLASSVRPTRAGLASHQHPGRHRCHCTGAWSVRGTAGGPPLATGPRHRTVGRREKHGQ